MSKATYFWPELSTSNGLNPINWGLPNFAGWWWWWWWCTVDIGGSVVVVLSVCACIQLSRSTWALLCRRRLLLFFDSFSLSLFDNGAADCGRGAIWPFSKFAITFHSMSRICLAECGRWYEELLARGGSTVALGSSSSLYSSSFFTRGRCFFETITIRGSLFGDTEELFIGHAECFPRTLWYMLKSRMGVVGVRKWYCVHEWTTSMIFIILKFNKIIKNYYPAGLNEYY